MDYYCKSVRAASHDTIILKIFHKKIVFTGRNELIIRRPLTLCLRNIISIMECRYFVLIYFNLMISSKSQHLIYIVHYNFI